MLFRYPILYSILLVSVFAQSQRLSEAFEQDRTRAHALIHDGKYKEAQELFGLLAKKAPEDIDVLFHYGYALYLEAETIDGSAANPLRKEARAYFLRAKRLGYAEPLLATMLEAIRDDGSKLPFSFSNNPMAESEMRLGERAFSERRIASAQEHYTRALEFDPKLSAAAVFLGDIQFIQQKYDEAGVWFAKAVTIDVNQSTGYRYWGDALNRSGHLEEAGEKYVQAVISSPGDGLAWRALDDWAQRKGLHPRHPATGIPRAGVIVKDGKVELKIEIAPPSDVLVVAYGMTRAKEAAKAVSEKRTYKHALNDEKLGLQALLEVGTTLLADPKQAEDQKITSTMLKAIQQLQHLSETGHLEPYIFFVRADQELALDYPAYREANREKLAAYLRHDFLGLPLKN